MSYKKRQIGINDGQDNKRAKNPDSGDTEAAIARAKARLLERSNSGKKDDKMNSNNAKVISTAAGGIGTVGLEKGVAGQEEEGRGGLNVEIHPLLRNTAPTRILPKNHNPLKQNVRKWFDPASLNPYLNQDNMSAPVKMQHKPRTLQFNEKGKYIAKGNELRERLRQEQEEQEKYDETMEKGLTANENIGEHLYKMQYPPVVEWWDKPYLNERNYNHVTDESHLIYDNENAPISIYIQHPVLIAAPWEKHLPEPKSMYLTKKEMKRIRRNDRKEKHKDQQDRIKLGLDPPPPPKVKLSNLMNVLTDKAIKDPTAVEMKVREEVEERYQKHMQQNEERKLTKEEKEAKLHQQHEHDLERGYFTSVYKVDNLSNPQHFFKVDINAKQLELRGICLLNPRLNLIIVEGGEKSIKFYKKLLTKRIQWTETATPKTTTEDGGSPAPIEDLSHNKCRLIWEGQIKDINFKKWSIMKSSNDDEALDVLNRFGIENYWREALVMDN